MDADQCAKYLSCSMLSCETDILTYVFNYVSALFQPGLKNNCYGQTGDYAVQLTLTHSIWKESQISFPCVPAASRL